MAVYSRVTERGRRPGWMDGWTRFLSRIIPSGGSQGRERRRKIVGVVVVVVGERED